MTYIELKTPKEIEDAKKYIDAWKAPEIPQRQFDIAVKHELEKNFTEVPPFMSMWKAMQRVYPNQHQEGTVLEIGASSGYYGQLITKKFNYKNLRYTALDYNPEFGVLSKKLWPEQEFVVGDALNLQYPDNHWDLVISGCCMLHIQDWPKAMQETVRVAKGPVILHRTPILDESPTKFFLKEAYGVPCIEIWFNRDEFIGQMMAAGLDSSSQFIPIFVRDTEYGRYGHYTIVAEKVDDYDY